MLTDSGQRFLSVHLMSIPQGRTFFTTVRACVQTNSECLFVPYVPWTCLSRSGASPLEIAKLWVMYLTWTTWLTATNPVKSITTQKKNFFFKLTITWWGRQDQNQSQPSRSKCGGIEQMLSVNVITYKPHSFLMPLWLFLFSSAIGESIPEDRGDWSDKIHSSGCSEHSIR